MKTLIFILALCGCQTLRTERQVLDEKARCAKIAQEEKDAYAKEAANKELLEVAKFCGTYKLFVKIQFYVDEYGHEDIMATCSDAINDLTPAQKEEITKRNIIESNLHCEAIGERLIVEYIEDNGVPGILGHCTDE